MARTTIQVSVQIEPERLEAIKAEAARRYLSWSRMIAVLAYERLDELGDLAARKERADAILRAADSL